MNKLILPILFSVFLMFNCTIMSVNKSDSEKKCKKSTLKTVLAIFTGASLSAGGFFLFKGLISSIESSIDCKNGNSMLSGVFQVSFGGALLGLGLRLLVLLDKE